MKSLLILCLIPCLACAHDRQAIDESYDTEAQYLHEQFCERQFHDLNLDQILELESCDTDRSCSVLALKLGISPECVQ